jgi:2,4-dienoyl-CoA reductase-like NADH-dependent reductase (Old Yellow Enzyme family)
MHLGNFAVSGAGLVITEATGVEPEGRISPMCLGLYSDACEAALARLIRFFREYGGYTKFGVQLAHAGRKGSVLPSFMVRKAVPPEEGGWIPPSPSHYVDDIHAPPRVLTIPEIKGLTARWVDATIRADRIGVDMIELHFAHGYLVNQFLSPLINQRTDRYGGSLENRMRFALEIYDACRAVWPEEKPIGVRISGKDWVEGGWEVEDSVALGHELKRRGCDYLCLTSGGVSLKQKIPTAPLYQVPLAAEVRRQTGIATMAVGQIWEPKDAEKVLQDGAADYVALARRMLYNPRWPWHAATELNEFIPYPPRYKSCHPLMGTNLKFAESPEQTKALEKMREAEARYSRQHVS